MSESIEEIWEGDVLGRQEDARFLQKYLTSRYQSKPLECGFVLAVNADWGYGKSFMLERWHRETSLGGHPSVFFDAWKNDFTPDPLLAFIAEFDEGLKSYTQKVPIAASAKAKVTQLIKKLWKPALKVLGGAALKVTTGLSISDAERLVHMRYEEDGADDSVLSEEQRSSIKKIPSDLGVALTKALDEHSTKKRSISDFKEKLSFLVAELGKIDEVKLPMIVFVDELDRCRPNYAIELLEGIKHLFGVPGVFFVIATNIGQLSESIKAVYGSGFDGHRYLKRFFDLTYVLPQPSNEQFANAVLAVSSFPPLGQLVDGLRIHESPGGGPVVLNNPDSIVSFVLVKHAYAFDLSLRDVLQVGVILDAALIALRGRQVHIFFLIFLIVLYQKDSVAFTKVAKFRILNDTTWSSQPNRNPASEVQLLIYDDMGSATPTSVSLTEIATAYLRSMEYPKGGESPHNMAHNFPHALFNNLAYKLTGGVYKADFSDYFLIVQHAGGFNG